MSGTLENVRIAEADILKNRQMKKKKKKPLGIKETDRLINELNLQPVLKDRLRQVRWLYNNGNKCRKVYDEKLVRLMIHRLQERIKELESVIQGEEEGWIPFKEQKPKAGQLIKHRKRTAEIKEERLTKAELTFIDWKDYEWKPVKEEYKKNSNYRGRII